MCRKRVRKRVVCSGTRKKTRLGTRYSWFKGLQTVALIPICFQSAGFYLTCGAASSPTNLDLPKKETKVGLEIDPVSVRTMSASSATNMHF